MGKIVPRFSGRPLVHFGRFATMLCVPIGIVAASPAVGLAGGGKPGGRYHDAREDARPGHDRGERYRRGAPEPRTRVDIEFGSASCEPVYVDRVTRVWVEPVYREVCDRVWVEAQFRTERDRVWVEPVYREEPRQVWVPDRFEVRTIVEGDGCWKRVRQVRVLVERGHYETTCERVLVCPGRWENVERQVLVCEGRWEFVTRQELVCAGRWEDRVERVRVDRPQRADGVGFSVFARIER